MRYVVLGIDWAMTDLGEVTFVQKEDMSRVVLYHFLAARVRN